MALSPASTMSIARTCRSAEIAAGVITLAMSIVTALDDAQRASQAQHMLAADPALINHRHPNVEDHGEADVIDPVMPLNQLGDIIRGETHEENRESQSDKQQRGVLARDGRDEKHIVEAHAE